MKLTRLFLIGLLTIAPLSACDLAQGVGLSLSHSSVQQASTVKAAGDLYLLANHTATAYLKSGHATKAQADTIAQIDRQVFAALEAARAADKKGDSPAVGAALAVFNQNFATLRNLVPGL